MGAEAPSVELRTLGCKVNRSESESLAESLALLGISVSSTHAPGAPDAIVVNTCTVTGEADAKARKEVRRALQATDGPVVVVGCLAAVDAEGLRALDPRVQVEPDRRAVAGLVSSALGAARHKIADDGSSLPRTRGRTRALVKVQDGCDNRCTYCIVPDARGVPRSESADAIIERVALLHAAGVAEIVLTGINIGRYTDPRAVDLAALIARIGGTGVRRIRLSSIEPPDLDARLIESLAVTPAVAPHLHVPLQSGCDRTLAAMGRHYDSAEFARILALARARVPGLVVTTDIIAGFPGETDADFEESVAFAAECGFAKLHVFRYSARTGTRAAAMSDQVPPRVRGERAGRLRELSDRAERAHELARHGTRAALLVEEVRNGVCRGTTEDHLRVFADLPGAFAGDLVPVELRATDEGVLRAYHVQEVAK